MQHDNREQKSGMEATIDHLLYLLAGGVMAVMSFSFFLWLRF